MGRIGRSYPRFPPTEQPAQKRSAGAFHITGAIVGLLAALGLIGWLLTR
jgi:hypothetical protein